MKITDAVTLSGTRLTGDGYLVAEANAVRTGIQVYRGAEVGLVERDVVRVYRSEDEVRAPDSMTSFSHAPITMGHPSQMVTADNWADLAKGEVSTEATWDGNKIKLPLIVKDAGAITALQNGTRELSAGYTCDVEFVEGTTPEGEAYDAIQKNIRINHLAIVPKGRAGSECRIGDAADARWGASPITLNDRKDAQMADTVKTRTVLIDGLSVETTDAGAQALEKLTKQIEAKDAQIADADKAHKAAIDAKDAEIATKDAEIEKLKGSQLSDADLDATVQARAELVGKAAAIAKDVKTTGLSDADIRKAVVVAKLGDEAIKGRSDAYIEARFDVLAEDAGKADPVVDAIKDAKPAPTLDAAYSERNAALADAWKQPIKQEA